MATVGLKEQYAAATAVQETKPVEAIAQLRNIVLGQHPNDSDSIKVKEAGITSLADLYAKQRDAQALRHLLTELRPLFGAIPKAKTAKIVRSIIEAVSRVPGSTQLQLEVCREQVEWARSEKRTFLRQRIEARLANLLLDTKDYAGALALISKLLTEVKRLDDKLLLVDIHLLESRTHHALRNAPKAKAALTAARTAANSIYIPPSLQAEIDSQSGTLHAEEKDFKTAYSYFYEAFEGLAALDDPRAVSRLKYMLLAKIMTGKSEAEEVPAIVASKAGIKYAGLEVDSMKAVSSAYRARSLQAFQETLDAHRAQLVDDPLVNTHLTALYGTMLEENLARIIEPYSRVEISHVAQLIQLPVEVVQEKLSLMILDGKLAGTLDQGAGCLDVFEEPAADKTYPAALSTFENMGTAIDTLVLRSHKIAVGGQA